MLVVRLPTENNNAHDEQQTNVLSRFDWAIRVQWTRKNNEWTRLKLETACRAPSDWFLEIK